VEEDVLEGGALENNGVGDLTFMHDSNVVKEKCGDQLKKRENCNPHRKKRGVFRAACNRGEVDSQVKQRKSGNIDKEWERPADPKGERRCRQKGLLL